MLIKFIQGSFIAFSLNMILPLAGSKIKAADVPTFDFIVEGQILRRLLDQHLQKLGKSFENVINIEYFERLPPPTPKESLIHDDWVSSVHTTEEW